MSANEQIKQIYRALLDDTHDTQDRIDSFFASDSWSAYPDNTTWDEIKLDVINECAQALEQRITHPAHFVNDYD